MASLLIVALAAVVALAFGVLTVAGAIDAPGGLPGAVRRLGARRMPVNYGHLVIGLVLLGALFLLAERPAGLLALGALVVLVLFAWAWVREFLFLMDLGDDELPGRSDKLIWALMLTAFAPVGLWLFRSYRRQRWPEPAPAPAPKPSTAPDGF